MGGGAQELEQDQSLKVLSSWEVGGGAQDLEQDQISEKMRSSGKWAAGPRKQNKTKVQK